MNKQQITRLVFSAMKRIERNHAGSIFKDAELRDVLRKIFRDVHPIDLHYLCCQTSENNNIGIYEEYEEILYEFGQVTIDLLEKHSPRFNKLIDFIYYSLNIEDLIERKSPVRKKHRSSRLLPETRGWQPRLNTRRNIWEEDEEFKPQRQARTSTKRRNTQFRDIEQDIEDLERMLNTQSPDFDVEEPTNYAVGDYHDQEEEEYNQKQKQDFPKQQRSSRRNTQDAMRNVRMDHRASDLLSGAQFPGDEIDDSDYVAPDDPVNTTELVVVTQLPDILKSGELMTGITPDWHAVKNLPGYMQQGIRRLGRSVFSQFTNTKIEDIVVLASLGGNGPNSPAELNAVAGWLKKNGKKLSENQMDFAGSISGYTAQVMEYTASGIRFMLVKDDFGQYIYSYPETDAKTHIGQNKTRQIREWIEALNRISRGVIK